MFSVIAGTVLLALVHALIPNHWLPLVAVAKAEQWKKRDVNIITFISAAAHVLGTVILGLIFWGSNNTTLLKGSGWQTRPQ